MTIEGPMRIDCAAKQKGVGKTGHCNAKAFSLDPHNVRALGVQRSQPGTVLSETQKDYVISERSAANPGVCTIDGSVINHCERKYPGSWKQMHYAFFQGPEGGLTFVAPTLNVVWMQDPRLSWAYYCKNISLHHLDHINPCRQNCTKETCQGDDLFCHEQGCTHDKACHCQHLPTFGMAKVLVGESWLIPFVVGVQEFFVVEELLGNPLLPRKCSTCSLTCTSEGISFHSIKDELKEITVCIEGSCSSRQGVGGKVWSIPFGNQMPRGGAQAVAQGLTMAGEAFSLSADCGVRSGCDQINCIFCTDMLSNPQCYPYGKWLLLCIMAGALYFVLSLSKFALQMLLMLAQLLTSPLMLVWKVSKCLGRLGRRRTRRTYTRLLQAIEEGDAEPDITADVKRVDKPKKMPRIVVFALMLLTVVGATLACDETHLISETSVVCDATRASHYMCTTKEIVVLKNLRAGKTICISIKGPGGVISKPLKIVMEDIVGRADLLDAYYTFTGQANCKSVRRCRWAGTCSSGCSGVDKSSFVQELGASGLHSHPNWLDCYDGCGGAACGCFNAAPSCIFLQRYVTNKDARVYKVFKTSAWFLNTRARVSVDDRTSGVTLKDGETKTIGKVSFSYRTDRNLFAGLSLPPIVSEIKASGKPNDFLFENQGSHPKCKDQNSAILSSSSGCIVDQNSITVNPRVDDVSCRSNLVSFNGMETLKPLPQRVGDFLVSFKGSEPVLLAVGSTNVVEGELRVDMSLKNFKIHVDGNICRGTLVSLKGCVGCSHGATANLKIHADKAGESSLECPSSSCRLKLEKGVNDLECSLRFSTPNVDETCVLVCSGSKEHLQVTGALLIGGDFKKLTDDSASNFEHSDSKTAGIHIGTGIGNWLSSLFGFSVTRWIIGIVGFILTFVVLVVCLKWLLFRVCRRSQPESDKDKIP
ncbi:glycoprotein precursor [Lone Star virus]|uniref:Envelopment polyprotein n=1 Tax=Lone Star virus TaxID=1219465 RepID=R4P2Q0_9VIRU|nr:glycoprotein precursor [Lone Star virus]AGL50922.1 glycoprotein precursor [Lone Star virus]